MFTQNNLDFLRKNDIYIHTHDFPDPDAFASAFGIQELLKHFDIKSTICFGGEIERTNLQKMLEIYDIKAYERDSLEVDFNSVVNILVDSQLNNSNMSLSSCENVYCIDHHPTFSKYNYYWKDLQEVGACSSIIASYFKENNIIPSKNCASSLIYGIKMDTNDFNRGTTKLDIEMFDYLFQYSDYESVTSMYQNYLVLSDFDAFCAALNDIDIFGETGFAYIPFQCPITLVAIISDFLLSTEEVKVAIVYSKFENKIKFSVRSEDPDIDAGELIHNALKGIGNGGGHPTMAGGVIYKEYMGEFAFNTKENIENRFMSEIQNMNISL